MENHDFQIGKYLTDNIERLIKDIIRSTAENPKESVFLARFALAVKKASRKRSQATRDGVNIPPFLIASITSSCNLHCAGCYSRHNHACTDEAPVDQLTADEWRNVFSQAKDMGISFILLAGGEPLMRRDVIEAAGEYPDILFPVFTNGTLFGDKYIKLFDKKRNLVPILSIEGARDKTDERRGDGVYEKLKNTMEALQKDHLIFGASVTVTTENMAEVTGRDFLCDIQKNGCKAVIYVEYVPVSPESRGLALCETERDALTHKLSALREEYPDMIFISFPGDEKSLGGCLAAGRGFFHINSHGGAEPCPFSPYSDTNVREVSLREVISSPLFSELRRQDIMLENHSGGCVLFENREAVENILSKTGQKN